MSNWVFKRVAYRPSEFAPFVAYLVPGDWNDYGYGTYFDLFISHESDIVEIGGTKIARVGMGSLLEIHPTTFTVLEENFHSLGSGFFSLGQDPEYYERLRDCLGRDEASRFLAQLSDLALNPDLISELIFEEPVLGSSLLRFVSSKVVADQFHRIIAGDDAKTSFNLKYELLDAPPYLSDLITFLVIPDSYPSSNVHVVIGSNGVGKTKMLRSIAATISGTAASVPWPRMAMSGAEPISGVVSLSFSAFDDDPPTVPTGDIRVAHISLMGEEVSNDRDENTAKELAGGVKGSANRPRNIFELSSAFYKARDNCRLQKKDQLLGVVLGMLETDPVLTRHMLNVLLEGADEKAFSDLSSGHKIVLLTLVTLVDRVEEKTLVLLDEPELHLHPPLLASFMRALSHLLITKNGLAIVATHSPVVLQEVPAQCVWKLYEADFGFDAQRPSIETFGESIGSLMTDVFRLELENSGHYALLRRVVAEGLSYEQVLERFDFKLGQQARAIVGALVRTRDEGLNF